MAFTITAGKELSGKTPVYLWDFVFADSSELHVATLGITKGAVTYEARVLEQTISAVEALSPEGIEAPPDVRVVLADADGAMRAIRSAVGFRGARVTVSFALYDFAAGAWSTDTLYPFVGRCGQAATRAGTLTVSAGHLLNFSARMAPFFPLQPRCPKIKPRDAAGVALANVIGSLYWPCGSGDTDDCGFTKAGCAAHNADPLRFGGFEYEIPPASRSREYATGKWLEDLVSDPCAAKFGDFAPLVYGTAWVDALVLSSWPEGNSTRGEAILCDGLVDNIWEVTVADEIVPPANNLLDLSPLAVADPLFRYNVISRGGRSGALTLDVPWNGAGDPHGSLAKIEWCVNRQAAQSTPRVRARITGPKVPWYQAITAITAGKATFALPAGRNCLCADVGQDLLGPSTVTVTGNANPALNGDWTIASYAHDDGGDPTRITGINLTGAGALSGSGGTLSWQGSSANYAFAMLDLMRRSGLALTDAALASFTALAYRCTAQVSYVDRDGNTTTHDRYRCSLVVRQRRSVADVLSGMLRGCDAHLGRDQATGQVAVFARGSLAEQQPAAMTGSNDNTEYSGGYFAYHFSESSIAREKEDGPSTFEFLERKLGSVPNSVTIGFNNEERDWSGDSARVVAVDDINAVGQEIAGNFNAEGVASLDQARRIGARYLAEQTGGEAVRWQSTMKGAFLTVGMIVGVTLAEHGLTAQAVRLTRIAPEGNGGRLNFEGTLHSDAWYADTFGQTDDPGMYNHGRNAGGRRPYPWSVTPTEFPISHTYAALADGSVAAQLAVRMIRNVNAPDSPIQPPRFAATVETTGGTIAGGQFVYVAVEALDEDFNRARLSPVVRVEVPPGTNTNKIVLAMHWESGSYASPCARYYAGASEMELRDLGVRPPGTPATVTITSIEGKGWPPADPVTDHYVVRAYPVALSGVFTGAVSAVGAYTLQFAGQSWTVDQWAGYDADLVAQATEDENGTQPWRRVVVSNTADTLTVSVALGGLFAPGDTVTLRALPTTHTATSIGDANLNLTAHSLAHKVMEIIRGKGKGQTAVVADNGVSTITWDTPLGITPDATSRFIVREATAYEERTESYRLSSDRSAASSPTPTLGAVTVPNAAGQSYWVQALSADAAGLTALPGLSQAREIWLEGAPGTVGQPSGQRTITASCVISNDDCAIFIDSTSGNVVLTLLPAADMLGRKLLVTWAATNTPTPPATPNWAQIHAAPGESFDNGSTSITFSGLGQLIYLDFHG